jgi:hypothetical protein
MGELNLESISYFILLWMPGFVSVKVNELLVAQKERDFSKSLYEIISYSLINYSIFIPIILIAFNGDFYIQQRFLFFVFIFLIFAAGPVVLPIIYYRLRKSRFLLKYISYPAPTAWNYKFNLREDFWIKIYLTSGEKYGGIFGTKSCVSSYPEEEQIYIQELWLLDDNGGFDRKVNMSSGGIFFKKDIKFIEFFK